MNFSDAMASCPLVAILRGLTPGEAEPIGAVLVHAGFTLVEVPLNSPSPLQSIATLSRLFGASTMIGAGTVMSAVDITAVKAAGGKLIVMPHCDPELIRHAKAEGLSCVPGVATPTEAFAALKAGADALKAFPAELITPAAIKAWLAVLPPGTSVIPVGGIDEHNMAAYVNAGARGFGLGSSLYKPGDTIDMARNKARNIMSGFRRLHKT
jgi:2-dehydro-3-deoxyphosphogalactonate aldolase